MAPILIIFSLMFIIGFVYCIYKNRVRQHQGPGGAVLYNPTQIPQVNVQHHYTLGTYIIIPTRNDLMQMYHQVLNCP